MRERTRLAMHVKLLDLPTTSPPPLPRWLQALEVSRPVLVGIEHAHRAPSERPRRVSHAERDELVRFLRAGSIGDVHGISRQAGDQSAPAFLVRILGHRADRVRRVQYVLGAGADPALDAARLRRLLDRAFVQFMPRMSNLIVICGPHDRSLAFDFALLGRPMERWDRFPRRGERVAVGRSDDGFWAGRSRPESRAVLWVPTTGRGADRRPVLLERSGAGVGRLPADQRQLIEDIRDRLARPSRP